MSNNFQNDIKVETNTKIFGKRDHKRHHKNAISVPKQWSFNETNSLMEIWSQIDLNSFEKKTFCYKQIQTELKKRGFERNVEQIRCKIKRLTSKKVDPFVDNQRPGNVFTTKQFVKTCFPSDSNQLKDTVNKTYLNDISVFITPSECESDAIDYDITLTEEESDSELYLFSKQICVSECDDRMYGPYCMESNTNVKSTPNLTLNCDDKRTDDSFLEAIEDTRHKTDECFQQIMCGQQQLKQSIDQFNKQLTRLTNSVLNNNENDFDLKGLSHSGLNSRQSSPVLINESINPWSKVIIPNLSKNFSLI